MEFLFFSQIYASSNFITIIILTTVINTESAPTKRDQRKSKSLSYFDYIQTSDDDNDFHNYIDEDFTVNHDAEYDSNEISRTIPTKRKVANPKPTLDSPIYYIRLPPQPYMFIPGLGYVSQPTEPRPDSLLNVPVNFISNGKPASIYQWNGAFAGFETPVKQAPKPEIVKKTKPIDSRIHRIPGKYAFNGKPNSIYVLNDSYNSIYGDALHSFYP